MNPFQEYKLVRAGDLTATYVDGTLRNISSNGTEILRMIYAAVRDEKWLNIPHEIVSEKIHSGEKEFQIELLVLFKKDAIELMAEYLIIGHKDNRITFGFKGTALSGFMKNRIGICVLHPPETCRGKECMITHPDQTTEKQIFPESIAPHQPFKNISSMAWKFENQAEAILTLEGDVFETEDQRNWTDASYKTYSTPLSIPYPAYIEKDTPVTQSAILKIFRSSAPVRSVHEGLVFKIEHSARFPLPEIGVCVSSRVEPLSLHEATLLKETGFRHLRGEIHLFSNYWPDQYKRMIHESILVGLPVELCLLFGDDPGNELAHFLNEFSRNPANVQSVLVLSAYHKATPENLLSEVMPVIRRALGGIPVGAGTNCNFAQLNRAVPDVERVDFISFAIHPQEHASDDRTLFENTAAQKDAVDSARIIARNKPVHVSPVTLQRRFNANVSNYEALKNDHADSAAEDPRQQEQFAAAWTVGSLKHLMESGAASVTYYETAGKRGVLNKNKVFPVYNIFRNLKAGYEILKTSSSHPLFFDGFSLVNDDKGLIFLANFTERTREIYCDYPVRQVVSLKPYETKILGFEITI